MKRWALTLLLTIVGVAAYAENMKGGLKLSIGQMILLFALVIAALAAIQLVISVVSYLALGAITKEPRIWFWPTYVGGFLISVPAIFLLGQFGELSIGWVIILVAINFLGNVIGFRLTPKEKTNNQQKGS